MFIDLYYKFNYKTATSMNCKTEHVQESLE